MHAIVSKRSKKKKKEKRKYNRKVDVEQIALFVEIVDEIPMYVNTNSYA